jgi:hypothetical protein
MHADGHQAFQIVAGKKQVAKAALKKDDERKQDLKAALKIVMKQKKEEKEEKKNEVGVPYQYVQTSA